VDVYISGSREKDQARDNAGSTITKFGRKKKP